MPGKDEDHETLYLYYASGLLLCNTVDTAKRAQIDGHYIFEKGACFLCLICHLDVPYHIKFKFLPCIKECANKPC